MSTGKSTTTTTTTTPSSSSSQAQGENRFDASQIEFLKQSFALFDKQNQNAVKLRDLPTVIRVTTGIRLNQEQLMQQIQMIHPALLEEHSTHSAAHESGGKPNDPKSQGFNDMMVPFETYLKILSTRMLPDDPEERERFLRKEEFNFIDVNHSGSISSGELRHVLKQIGENLSEEEVRKMIDDVDEDKNNSISFEEFVKQYIDQFCNPDTPVTQRTVALSHIHDISLEQCIQMLGPYITNTEATIRSLGYRILHKIMQEETMALKLRIGDWNDKTVPMKSRQQRVQSVAQTLQARKKTFASLCRFFADRMQDFEGLVELLPCVELLLSQYHPILEDAEISVLLTQTFQDVNTHTLKQSTRKIVYDIFDHLMTWYPHLCKVDFLYGFVQSADGERDPVNLLAVMKMVPRMVHVVHEESVRMMAEELFDTILSPYFPINFSPPPNDKRAVSPQQLSEALRNAMASTPYFSTYCITFFLDKLSSQIIDTKVVTLQTLAYCVVSYGENYTRPFLIDIWNAIRTEVLRSSSPDVIRACLDAIIEIARTVATTSSITINMANLEGLIKPTLAEVRSPEPRFAMAYSTMLTAAGESSEIVATYIFNAVTPQICRMYNLQKQQQEHQVDEKEIWQETSGPSAKTVTLTAMLILARSTLEPLAKYPMQSIRSCVDNITKLSQVTNGINAEYGTAKGLEELQGELTNINSRLAAFDDIANVGDVFPILERNLMRTEEKSSARDNTIKSIEWLHSVGKDDLIIRRVVEPLFQALAESGGDERVLDTLTRIGTSCGEVIACIMTEKLFAGINESSTNSRLKVMLLQVLEKVIEIGNSELTEQAVDRIMGIMADMIHSGAIDAKTVDERGLESIARITGRLFRDLPEEEQTRLLTRAISVVLHGDIGWTHTSIAQPFQPLLSAEHGQFLVPLSAMLVHSRPQSITSTVAITELCDQLVQHVIMSELHIPVVINGVKHALASLTNKIDRTHVETFTESSVPNLFMPREAFFQQSHNVKLQVIDAMAWILKAAVMRGANKMSDFISLYICKLLLAEDETISNAAAEVFRVVMTDARHVLDPSETHAKVQVLHKQRFFSINMNALIKDLHAHRDIKEKSTEQRDAAMGPLLLSVAYLIQNVSKTVIVSEMERVFPLLLSALNSSVASPNLVLSALKTIHVLLNSAQDKMCEYLDSIVVPLIKLTTFGPSMSVRIAAVQCLQTLVDYPFHKLYPHKDKIIRGLAPVLDDRKRVVRQEAAKCRNVFYLLTE